MKQKRQDDTNKLFTDLGVFWAFSNEQFTEGYAKAKENMQEGEKLADIGAGGYMPRRNYDALIEGMKAIEKTFKDQIRDAKARETHILYELNNHEAYYANNIDSTMDALSEDYTREEVIDVYKKYKSKKNTRPTLSSDYAAK